MILVADGLLWAVSLVAIAALASKYGGFRPEQLPLSLAAVDRLLMGVASWFILDRLFRLIASLNRKKTLRQNWLDYTLVAMVAIAFPMATQMASLTGIYIILTQGYVLASLLLRLVATQMRIAESPLPPGWVLIGSFTLLALVGSLMLMLPAAVEPEFRDGWYYSESLFTATSATCVTGLVVADTGRHFTPFGQAVILMLIQAGGLGVMIFGSVLATMAGKSLSVRSAETLSDMLAHDRYDGVIRLAWFVVGATLLFELIGAVLLLPRFLHAPDNLGHVMALPQAIWYSVFHSISAFCNAGFSLYDANLMAGVTGQGGSHPLRNTWQVLGVIAPLIVLGGLGFPVLQDLVRVVRARRRRELGRLSLHSRLVLVSTGILILGGAIVLGLVEKPLLTSAIQSHGYTSGDVALNDWQGLSTSDRTQALLFQSISARTAGFNTVNMGELSNAGKLWMVGLMTVGGSPASTAGGLKTVTVVLLILAVWAVLRRRRDIEVFGRCIPEPLLRRAVTMAVLYGTLLAVVTLLLCMSMPEENGFDLLFEAASACGTVGLSTGVTERIGLFQHILLTVAMFVGRVGPLTFILAVAAGMHTVHYTYPDENVLIG